MSKQREVKKQEFNYFKKTKTKSQNHKMSNFSNTALCVPDLLHCGLFGAGTMQDKVLIQCSSTSLPSADAAFGHDLIAKTLLLITVVLENCLLAGRSLLQI